MAIMSAFGGKADIEAKGFYFHSNPKPTFPFLIAKAGHLRAESIENSIT
jgi:hypothetical protein